MNVEYINPFIEASQMVLKQVVNLELTLGKVYIKTSPYEGDSVVVIIGVTGKIRGQVILSMSKKTAMKLASLMMMGYEVSEFDEMAKSAISELANMILGNTATIFYNRGISIEITPPSLLFGRNIQISTNRLRTICVPMNLSNGEVLELDIIIDELNK